MTSPAGVEVLIRRTEPDATLPTRAHPGDAGWDLYAAHEALLAPGERGLVGTGIAIALPAGYAAFVLPRSGLAHRHGVTTLNAPGTIDAGYRGEIKVNLVNHDRESSFRIARGDRIAQLVVQAIPEVIWHEAERLPGSARGEGGHGSSGGLSAPSRHTGPPESDAHLTSPMKQTSR